MGRTTENLDVTKTEKITDRKAEDLNPRALAFCEHYALVGSESYSNATGSALKAGYSKSSARSQSWRLLRRKAVREKIRQTHADQMSRAHLAADKVLADLENLRLRALERNDLAVAARCSELQGKHLAMFSDRAIIAREGPERQRELDDAEKDEGALLATMRLRLPCPSYADTQDVVGDSQESVHINERAG